MARRGPKRIGTLEFRRLRVGVAVAVAIGLTAGLAVTLMADGRAVLAGIARLPLGWLAAALALSVLSWLGQGLGFAALTRQGIRGHLFRMTVAFLGGDFAALVTPFGSGGIPAGVFCLTREGLSVGESSAVIGMHSVLTGLFFLIAGPVAAVMMPVQSRAARTLVWLGVAAIGVAMVFIVLLAARPHRAIEWLERTLARPWLSKVLGARRAARVAHVANHEARRFAHDIDHLTHQKPARVALSFLGLSLSRACLIACLPVIMYGLGWRGQLLPMLATAVGAMALAIVSPTPGGSGAVEAATAALLTTQAPAAIAGAGML